MKLKVWAQRTVVTLVEAAMLLFAGLAALLICGAIENPAAWWLYILASLGSMRIAVFLYMQTLDFEMYLRIRTGKVPVPKIARHSTRRNVR